MPKLLIQTTNSVLLAAVNSNGSLSVVQSNWHPTRPGSLIRWGRGAAVLAKNTHEIESVFFRPDGTVSENFANGGLQDTWDVEVKTEGWVVLYDRGTGNSQFVDMAQRFQNPDWRKTWDILVGTRDLAPGRGRQMFLYDRSAGEGDIVGFNDSGAVSFDVTSSGLRKTWDTIVAGRFVPQGSDSLLFYDRQAGEADVVTFNSDGQIVTDTTNVGWRQSWEMFATGRFLRNGGDQVLLYDRAAGEADVVGFDKTGSINADTTVSGLPSSWEVAAVAPFFSSFEGLDSIIFYDRQAGQLSVVKLNPDTGSIALRRDNPGFPNLVACAVVDPL